MDEEAYDKAEAGRNNLQISCGGQKSGVVGVLESLANKQYM